MKHFASTKFWARYRALPTEVRERADKNYQLLKSNPRHPSLHFKKIGGLWIWIGTHAEYDKLVT